MPIVISFIHVVNPWRDLYVNKNLSTRFSPTDNSVSNHSAFVFKYLQVLYGIRGTNRARVLSVRTGKTVFEISMKEAGSIITAVNATAEYCLVACRAVPISGVANAEVFFVEVSRVRSVKN